MSGIGPLSHAFQIPSVTVYAKSEFTVIKIKFYKKLRPYDLGRSDSIIFRGNVVFSF